MAAAWGAGPCARGRGLGRGAPAPAPPRPEPGAAASTPAAVSRVRPAVVGHRSYVPATGRPSATLGDERAGSATVIEPDGLAVTVGYLVLEAARIDVTLEDGRRTTARVVGHDFESGLALIRLDPTGAPTPPRGSDDRRALAPGNRWRSSGSPRPPAPVGVMVRVTCVGPFVAYWEYLLDRAVFVAPHHPAFGGAALVDPDGALVGVVSAPPGRPATWRSRSISSARPRGDGPDRAARAPRAALARYSRGPDRRGSRDRWRLADRTGPRGQAPGRRRDRAPERGAGRRRRGVLPAALGAAGEPAARARRVARRRRQDRTVRPSDRYSTFEHRPPEGRCGSAGEPEPFDRKTQSPPVARAGHSSRGIRSESAWIVTRTSPPAPRAARPAPPTCRERSQRGPVRPGRVPFRLHPLDHEPPGHRAEERLARIGTNRRGSPGRRGPGTPRPGRPSSASARLPPVLAAEPAGAEMVLVPGPIRPGGSVRWEEVEGLNAACHQPSRRGPPPAARARMRAMPASIAGSLASRCASTHWAPTWRPTSRFQRGSRQVVVVTSTRTLSPGRRRLGTNRWTRRGRGVEPSSRVIGGVRPIVHSVRRGGAVSIGVGDHQGDERGAVPGRHRRRSRPAPGQTELGMSGDA